MKNTSNLKPDVVLNDYWSNNERFADLFNQVFFQGEDSIDPRKLCDKDTEESAILMEQEQITSISRTRDVIKQYTDGAELILMGVESQNLSDLGDKDCYLSRYAIQANSTNTLKMAV